MNHVDSRTLLTAGLILFATTSPSLARQQPASPPSASASQEAAPPAPAAPLVESIKIIVDDRAKSSGEIRFVVTPEGGAATTIRVTVQDGMGKQAVCRDIAKEFKVALGSKFAVDHYDDDKVKVAGKDNLKFSLVIAAQTVTGLSVKLN